MKNKKNSYIRNINQKLCDSNLKSKLLDSKMLKISLYKIAGGMKKATYTIYT